MSNNVRYFRRSKEFDLTQKELAERVGVSVVTIYKIENGLGANVQTALRLANFFGCSVEDLFEMEEE